MTLDRYLSESQRKTIEQYQSTLTNAPILGVPYFHLKENRLYGFIRDHPILSREYAKWIAPKLYVDEYIVLRDDLRMVFYATTDSLTSNAAPLLMEIEQRIRAGRDIDIDELNNLANKYGIDIIPAYHFLEFLRSLRGDEQQPQQQVQAPQQGP